MLPQQLCYCPSFSVGLERNQIEWRPGHRESSIVYDVLVSSEQPREYIVMIMMECIRVLVIALETHSQLAMLQKDLHRPVMYGVPVDSHVGMQ